MTEIMTLSSKEANYDIRYILVDGEPWFKGKEVATALGYADTKKAISKNVDDCDIKKLGELNSLSKGDWQSTLGKVKED